MSQERHVAFVTGASRGIGKAIALALAEAGFDVAIGARTIEEGESRERSSTLKKSNTEPLPGSLQQTAKEIEARGTRCLAVYLDLLDAPSVGSAVATVEERWGRIDVVVNNARYIGPGHMDRLLDTPIDLIERQIHANAVTPLAIIKMTIPGMLRRGHGIILNVTSGTAMSDPSAPAGEGGWGLGYGMSKAAMHRIVGILAQEHADSGIHFFNVDPGLVGTERMAIDMAEYGFDASTMAAPSVIGRAVAWLVTSPDRAELNGQTIDGQQVAADLPDPASSSTS